MEAKINNKAAFTTGWTCANWTGWSFGSAGFRWLARAKVNAAHVMEIETAPFLADYL